ncbi:MAG: polyketide cyclase [Actinobacteria bacterium]|nr:polyketide cyclase [Actinomycetota bacterium]
MDINTQAPVIAREEIRIDADVQTVWDVLADVEHWPSWNKGVRSMTLHGSVATGTSFEWKAGPGTIKSRIAEVDPPHRIVWTGVTLGIKAVDAFSFEASEGGTLVRQAESWEGLPVRFLRSRMERTLRGSLREGLRSLKSEAERRAAAAAAA